MNISNEYFPSTTTQVSIFLRDGSLKTIRLQINSIRLKVEVNQHAKSYENFLICGMPAYVAPDIKISSNVFSCNF